MHPTGAGPPWPCGSGGGTEPPVPPVPGQKVVCKVPAKPRFIPGLSFPTYEVGVQIPWGQAW